MRALVLLAVTGLGSSLAMPSLARADAALYILMRDGHLARVQGERTEPVHVPGTVRAFAVDGAKLYAATREGPLWELDLVTKKTRDLGLGGWWSTLALAAAGGKLYAATQAGKLWEIDPAAGTKKIVQMSGWEGALSLAIAR